MEIAEEDLLAELQHDTSLGEDLNAVGVGCESRLELAKTYR